MSAIVDKIRREPALLVGLVTAILIALSEFGVDVSTGQQAAIVGVIIAVGSIIVRSAVTPNISVGALEDDQGSLDGELMAGPASDVPTGDPVDVVARADYQGEHRERGAVDSSVLIALAAIVVILCGLVWLFQAL